MKKTRRSYNSTLRKQTPKTRDRNLVWRDICLWRINFLIAKYGYIKCEYCGEHGCIDSESLLGVWGHHIDGERDNCQLENCYICHHKCHSYITDNNIEVRQGDFQGIKEV